MFKPLLESLDAYLRDVETCIEFVKRSVRLQSHVGKWLAWDTIDTSGRQFIDEYITMHRRHGHQGC